MQSEGTKRKLHVPVEGHKGITKSDRAGGAAAYEVHFADSDGRWQYFTVGPDLKEALAKQVEITHRKNTTGYVSSTATLADVYADWVAERDVRPGSARTYDFQWKKHIEPALGSRKVREIDERAIRRFVRDLKRQDGKPGPLADSTRRLIYATLNVLLKHAAQDMRVLGVVPRLAKPPRQSEGRTRILSHDEERTLLAYTVPFKWLGPIVRVALSQGLRLGEACALRWEDIEFGDDPTITIRHSLDRDGNLGPTKTGKEREIEMLDTTKQVLLDLRLDAPGGEGFVFRNSYGEVRKLRDVQRAFSKARRRAGLDDVVFHSLRHTCASRLANHPEIPLKDVSSFLGHASLAQTEKYVHRIKGPEKRVRMSAAMAGAS